MRTFLLSSVAFAALLPVAAQAADPAPLSEVVITATRLPSNLEDVTGAHVIDRAELDARQSPFAADVLATIPGVGVTSTGAFGGVTAIRIRGAAPDQTLVLVDGVPVGDPSAPNGDFDASQVETADLDRIEVLSGPQGSLWGSDALSGVVSFVTRELHGLRANVEGGAFRTIDGSVAGGVATDGYALNGGVSAFHSRGISKAASGTEKDGFDTVSANLGGRLKVSDTLTLDGRLRFTDSDIAIDGFAPPNFVLGDTPDHSQSRAWSGFGRATLQALGLTHEFSFSDYDIHRNGQPTDYTADRQVYRYTASRGGAGDPLGFEVGAERTDTGANLAGRPSTDLSDNAAFGVVRVTPLAPLVVTASLRYDDPDRYKGRATGRISAAASTWYGVTVTASAGQGFKVPTISQVVCDFCFSAPVPLKSERSTGYDLRLGWVSDDHRLSAALTGYTLRVHDQIIYGQTGHYENLARTRSTGLEAEADAQLTDSLRLKLAYAVMDAIDATTRASLLRVPDHSGAASLFWTQDAWGAAFTVRGESSQSDIATDGFSPAIRKGFVVADLAGSYQLNDHVTFTARVENLADKRYQEAFGYGEPGRALYVGVKLKD